MIVLHTRAMQLLAKKGITPPGGFRYIDEDTKQEFKAPSKDVLVKRATVHRVSNSLEVPNNFAEIIEDWICQRMPPGVCKNSDGHVSRGGKHGSSTATSAIRGSSAMSRLMRKSKRKPVSQKIADSRALVCSSCSQNVRMSGCMGCRGIKGIIQEMRNNKGTKHDKRLYVCNISGILNHIQIFIDDRTIRETMKTKLYPDSCWKLSMKGTRKNED